jgi:DNA-binding MarR family transcriptional regulator
MAQYRKRDPTGMNEIPGARSGIVAEPITERDIPRICDIEQFFFAYRDFTADPDRLLQGLGFGRAHHRALYFVNRQPGMTVADLLGILGITKQSLSRVLRQLIDAGHIVQVEGHNDRRQRLLFPTGKGRELILDLSRPQSRRIDAALKACGLADDAVISKFMRAMTNAGPKGRHGGPARDERMGDGQ